MKGGYVLQTTLYMLQEQGDLQMMSYVLQTREGNLIVIDGGGRAEAKNLTDTLVKLGGGEPTVDLWLLTHPHADHVGALLEIFSKPNPLKVKRIYSRFLPHRFYEAYDPAKCVDVVTPEFERLAADNQKICVSFERGQVLTAGSVRITVLRVPDTSITEDAVNNSSVVFRVDAEGQRILFVGDLGEEAGERVMEEVTAGELAADFVQMAHHGQNGVKKSFYEAVGPRACLWNTPVWLWNNTQDVTGKSGYNTGPFQTVAVQGWMKELGVRRHFVTKDGEQVLPLPYPL